MKNTPFTWLWVIDEWKDLDPKMDTTLRVAEFCKEQGDQNFFCRMSDCEWNGLQWNVFASPHPRLESPTVENLAALDMRTVSAIHFRKDPPVNDGYLKNLVAFQQIGRQLNIPVLNPPHLLQSFFEKLSFQIFPKFSPLTWLGQNPSHLKDFIASHSQIEKWVLKPLDGAFSSGVQILNASDLPEAFNSAQKAHAENSNRPFLVQEYLPEIRSGEIRHWFVNGVRIQSFRKKNSHSSDVFQASSQSLYSKVSIDEHESSIELDEVSQWLKKNQVCWAAVDFIGGKLVDFNLTSPGLLKEMESTYQESYAPLLREGMIEAIKFLP